MARGLARFGRRQRLRTPAEYRRVFDNARRYADKYLLLLVRENDLSTARLGLALARRKIPTAAARNRIKRIVRESFRRRQEQLAGLDIVVLAQTDLSQVANHVLFESLEKHWARIASHRQTGL